MPIKTYDLSELPTAKRGRRSDSDTDDFLAALRAGKAAGDGLEYETSKDARRVCVNMYARLSRRAVALGLERPQQVVWQDPDGKWRWAVRPRVASEGGGRQSRRTKVDSSPEIEALEDLLA